MDLPINHFKRALKAGKPQIGLWCTLASPYSMEIVSGSGFDWALLDTEHTPNDLQEIMALLHAVAAGNAGMPHPVHPVVRPAWNDNVLIKRYLDIGAQSLLIPYVQNADEAQNAVDAMRYPPEGLRGVSGLTRATRFGRVKDYAKRAHEELCLMVQIETQEGLDNLDKICAVDGVDGVFIGPGDLHASLGYAGETANPKVMPLIDDAIVRIRKAGKAPGILTGNEQHAKHWLEIGCQFTAVGIDAAILARETEKLAARFKS